MDKTGIFRAALKGTAEMIAETMNRHAIPRLFAKNGWKPATLPKIKPSNVEAPDLAQLGAVPVPDCRPGLHLGPGRRHGALPAQRRRDARAR